MRARTVVPSIGVLAIAATLISLAVAGASASPSPAGVQLGLAHGAYRAGQSITVTIVNGLRSPIIRATCFQLQRRDEDRWVTVTHTHGVALPCSEILGVPQPAGRRMRLQTPLYDDLVPGEYLITLRYKPTHGPNLGSLRGPDARSVDARLTVVGFRTGAMPTLSEQRIVALAEREASESGDSKPTLIQHAAGTHFEAVLVSSGDLVFAWNWSYLIAIRGHFVWTSASVPPGAKPPKGRVITLVVDARTGQVTDGGIGNRYPQLAKLGPVTTDLQAPA